jgi:hypothetical protein
MSTNFDIPECINANNSDWKCPRSNTYIAQNTETFLLIICRTCGGRNVWPKPKAEARGRYEAGLMAEAREQKAEEENRRKRSYSFGGS